MDLKRCFKIIEDFGFNVDMESKYIQQHTPLGEDWNINFDECENAKELIECLENCLDGVDDDTTTFVDMRGTHGIPDDLQAIVEDGEWKKQILKDMIKRIDDNNWADENFRLPLNNENDLKEKLETIKEYANKIDEIWYNEISDENRAIIDQAYNSPVSEHIRWLLADIEEVLKNDLD